MAIPTRRQPQRPTLGQPGSGYIYLPGTHTLVPENSGSRQRQVQNIPSQNTLSTALDPNNLQHYTPTGGGTYGEGSAFGAVDYLKNLRGLLDAGQIDIPTFIKFGEQAAKNGLIAIGNVAGRGGRAANLVNPLISQIESFGFKHTGGGINSPTTQVNLPEQYQQEVRRNTLPSNIPPEERQQILDQIPSNIDINSDQGRIEIERIREQIQADKALKQQQGLRDTAITGLQGVIGQQADIRNKSVADLAKQFNLEADRQFSLDQPGIFESLQGGGLLRSSALGEALARERSKYTGDVANRLSLIQYGNAQQSSEDLNKLAAARLAGTDQDVNAIQQALISGNQLQQGGLQRQFGLQDFQQQAELARQIAAMQTANLNQGRGGGFSLTPALTAASLGTAFAPGIGTAIGGGAGLLYGLGRSSGRGGGGK